MGSYDNYLKSSHWRKLRKKVLQRAKGKCEKEGCSREATQVHHLTYKRLGHEKLSDLQAICFPCHRNCHPDKDFPPPEPVDANHFDCEFCPSHRGDLYIGHAKLHFICCGCGESTWRFRRWKRKQMNKGKKKAAEKFTDEDRTCKQCGKMLANPSGLKQHVAAKHGPKSKTRKKKKRKKKNSLRCVCGKTFDSYTKLRAHQRQGHA